MLDLISSFENSFNKKPVLLGRAPGRVNLLGEHVDYNQGSVLPVAIDRAVYLAVAPNREGLVNLHALDLNKRISFHLDQLRDKKDVTGDHLRSWALYPAGVAWALGEAGLKVPGMEAVYHSDIPIGAGLSSSAAVEVGFAVAWQALGNWQLDLMALAQVCQHAENSYVGVSSGLMDQFASAHGVAGHALYFDTRSLEWEALPLPAKTNLVIADSGVRRSLTGSAYNERRAACEQAVELLRHHLPGIRSLRDVSPVEFAAYAEYLPPIISRRAEHVVKEIARVDSAVTALRTGNTQSFGALMFAGHASLRDLYEVSIPELDLLVEIARKQEGCYGARLTGAGFGGCTINLVEESSSESFVEKLRQAYQQETGRKAQVFVCKASQGATVEEI